MSDSDFDLLWGNPNKPSAFSGQSIFLHHNPEFTKKQIVEDELPKIPTYQKFRTAKAPQVKNPYFVRHLRKVFQSDLIFMRNPPELVKDNDGFQYILIVQDIFSRKVWAAALKNKSAEAMKPVLENIFSRLEPLHDEARLVIDRGTEYINNAILRMLRRFGVTVTHPSTGHASHVERANLSLQRLLFQRMDFESVRGSPRRWVGFLPGAVKTMNSRYHRIIKMSPNNAELPGNIDKVNEAMSIYRQKAHEKEMLKHKKKQPKHKVGDRVRVQKESRVFGRGYERTFTTEIFKITKVLDHLPITMYTIADKDNKEIQGNFYPQELSLVKGDVFKIEKVLKFRTVNGVRQMLVKWQGYPASQNSWVAAHRLQ